jgi:hypothetical protein
MHKLCSVDDWLPGFGAVVVRHWGLLGSNMHKLCGKTGVGVGVGQIPGGQGGGDNPTVGEDIPKVGWGVAVGAIAKGSSDEVSGVWNCWPSSASASVFVSVSCGIASSTSPPSPPSPCSSSPPSSSPPSSSPPSDDALAVVIIGYPLSETLSVANENTPDNTKPTTIVRLKVTKKMPLDKRPYYMKVV